MKRQHHLPTLADPPFFCLPNSVGVYSEFPDHAVSRPYGTLGDFNIHMVASGRGVVEFEGETYTLTAGDAFLYFPQMEQIYYSSEDEPWEIYWVHFYGGPELIEFLTERGYRRTPIWTVNSWKELVPAFMALLEEAESHSFLRPAKLSFLTYAIIAEFMSRAEPYTGGRGVESADRLARLLPLLRSRAHEPFVLEEWADKAGVSTYYFCKLFRKSTQMSPLEFVTLCRLQRAKQLLLEQSDWTVKRIAAEVGYANASYFNKRFMEQEKATPLDFRRSRLGLR